MLAQVEVFSNSAVRVCVIRIDITELVSLTVFKKKSYTVGPLKKTDWLKSFFVVLLINWASKFIT